MSGPWLGLDQGDKERSKVGVLAHELYGKGGEAEVNVSTVLASIMIQSPRCANLERYKKIKQPLDVWTKPCIEQTVADLKRWEANYPTAGGTG